MTTPDHTLTEREALAEDEKTLRTLTAALVRLDKTILADMASRLLAEVVAAAATLATVRADAGRLALLEMADEIDRGPTFPLPPSVISALIRERAEAIRGVISALIRERAEQVGTDD